MTTQKKMIIITSNEDIIQQISLNQTENTRIIDLDNVNTMTTNQNNEDIFISLALLANLSQSVRI